MSLLLEDSCLQQETNTNTHFLLSDDPLAIIYNENMWRLNKVSPLCKLQYGLVKLKKTGAMIRQAIVGMVQATTAKYTVAVKELPNLKYSEQDSSALMITVSSSLGRSNSKVVYMAILLSWGVSENIEKATHLPYMLERGEQRVAMAVKSTLQTLYDCSIKQFTFTQHQLLQFGFNFVETDTLRSTDPFTFVYKTPQVDHKDKLNLTFEVGVINVIWNGIKNEDTSQSEQVTQAYQILQNQLFEALSLDIIIFDLCEISLPRAEIKNNGVVKMKTPEIVNCLFTLLNEISDIKSNFIFE